jgi:hypothetical protein
MRWLACCLLLIVLTGCVVTPQDDSPEAVCRREAYNDPKVKALLVQNLGWAAPDQTLLYQISLAERAATQKCLQDKGIAVRGGVEPVQRQMY